MSREIDVNDPDSWDDSDREYLRERIDTVPAQHRAVLMEDQTPPVPPAAVAEHPGIARLSEFVRMNFPERAGEDPVSVVIDELGGEEVEEDEGDDYDTWKLAELQSEANKRGLTVQADGNKKAPWIDALRQHDASTA